MNEKKYAISDAAHIVNVETHVLRYWEEELNLFIPRNEMGHRYYTDENIALFQNILKLKEDGFQLKSIHSLLPDLASILALSEKERYAIRDQLQVPPVSIYPFQKNAEAAPYSLSLPRDSATSSLSQSSTDIPSKMEQFQTILQKLIEQSLQNNNKNLSDSVSDTVATRLTKELDFLLREKEDVQEERFKQLDSILRSIQKSNQEAAATTSPRWSHRRDKKSKKLS